MTVRIWDLEGQAEACCMRGTDLCFSTSWSRNGAVLVTASRDRKLRVMDPRANAAVAEFTGHAGTKGQRAVWCGDSSFIFSVGAGSMAQREFKLWDCRKIGAAVQTETIDNGGGNILPLHDGDTNIIYLVGKGDVSMRWYELHQGSSKVKFDDTHSFGGEPSCGACLLPKRMCDVPNIELNKLLRLTPSTVEPISFTLPRAEKLRSYFQDDIYPPTPTGEPGQDAEGWRAGNNIAAPVRSLQPPGSTPLSQKPVEKKVVKKTTQFTSQINKADEEEKQRVATFSRLQGLAKQASDFNPNLSMGRTPQQAAEFAKHDLDTQHGDDSDDNWD
jgi:hypothetical protein